MPGYAPSYLWPPAAIPTGARCPRGRRSRTRPPAAPLPPCRARASPELRPPVLKAHLDRFGGELQRFIPIPRGSPVKAFNELAPRYREHHSW